ncbi:Protoheme IX farnesyltransferase, mitochondrial {ECO:0000256/PIRNR:PIRNR001773} {ECO:0000256/PIRNR:PIRNR001773}; AltName: Full=Heme O synthase {ECO:0000256/PIRNR:PIRNR001773} [Serendipita indica DSM 11827]|nr:Protoheme IX farnesyltransferase, mitochondrial {ECO:0000256/PIRNR:PIRNR001773} {ECO:0000256/PIRNR:PIRNR001773}; AltName: Full=Heme O synthase {ECO:0000256/PIRNR:PIRNR001773} [Serendipita indica DSM 11827]
MASKCRFNSSSTLSKCGGRHLHVRPTRQKLILSPQCRHFTAPSTLSSPGESSWARKPPVPFFTSNQSLSGSYTTYKVQHLRSQTLSQHRLNHGEREWPPSVSLEHYKPIPPLTLGTTLKVYAQLSKARLTVLVVLTAMSGVALSPLPVGLPVLLGTALGTTLCSAAANTFNQISEVPFDAQMARTRNRPLVRKAISPFHAACFGAATGIAGPAILLAYAGPVTAALGLGNIFSTLDSTPRSSGGV